MRINLPTSLHPRYIYSRTHCHAHICIPAAACSAVSPVASCALMAALKSMSNCTISSAPSAVLHGIFAYVYVCMHIYIYLSNLRLFDMVRMYVTGAIVCDVLHMRVRECIYVLNFGSVSLLRLFEVVHARTHAHMNAILFRSLGCLTGWVG